LKLEDTGFPLSERTALGLEGRLLYKSNTLEHWQQCDRANYEQLLQRDSPIRKNSFLRVSEGRRAWHAAYNTSSFFLQVTLDSDNEYNVKIESAFGALSIQKIIALINFTSNIHCQTDM
jgi:hypothetical protein